MNVFSVLSVQQVSAAVWRWHCVCLLWCVCICKLLSTAEISTHANRNTQWDIFHVNIRVSSLAWTTICLLLWRREGGVQHLETGNEVRLACCTHWACCIARQIEDNMMVAICAAFEAGSCFLSLNHFVQIYLQYMLIYYQTDDWLGLATELKAPPADDSWG